MDPTSDPSMIDFMMGDMDPTSDPTSGTDMGGTQIGTDGPTQYIMGHLGSECAEENLITTAADCEVAANMNETPFVMTLPFNLWNSPSGCIAALSETETLEIYFNE